MHVILQKLYPDRNIRLSVLSSLTQIHRVLSMKILVVTLGFLTWNLMYSRSKANQAQRLVSMNWEKHIPLCQGLDFLRSAWDLNNQNNARECSTFDLKLWIILKGRFKTTGLGVKLSLSTNTEFLMQFYEHSTIHCQETSLFVPVPVWETWKLLFKHPTVHAEAFCPCRCYFPQIMAK